MVGWHRFLLQSAVCGQDLWGIYSVRANPLTRAYLGKNGSGKLCVGAVGGAAQTHIWREEKELIWKEHASVTANRR